MRALEEERAARDAAERQLLALTAEKRLLEHRVINARRTLAYGLGRAFIEARSVKGILALPGRIRQLRVKQKAKRRERVPNSFADNPAALLKLVDPALERAADDGAEAAAEWVVAQDAGPEIKARALCEVAHRALDNDAALAARIGLDAAAFSAADHRFFALAVRLYEAGLVAAPAQLCAQFRDSLTLSDAQLWTCVSIEDDAALLERGAWELPAMTETGGADRSGLAILCSPRWAALPQVAQARVAAASAGLSVSVIEASADADFADFAIAHIFADSLETACSVAADARAAGCRVIVDLANPPASMLAMPESERAKAEAIRLTGLGAGCAAIVTRSGSMARRLTDLGIDYHVASDAGVAPEPCVDQEAIGAAMTEFGARSGVTTIGCIATLDDDPGLLKCLDSFAALAAEDENAQLIVIGRGPGSGRLAREARRFSAEDRVHFTGNPPPQRWPALVAGLDLAMFPRLQEEPLGSEIPALMLTALVLQRPVLATEAAWNAQSAWTADPQSILPDAGDWRDLARTRLQGQGDGSAMRARDGTSLDTIYRSLSKSL